MRTIQYATMNQSLNDIFDRHGRFEVRRAQVAVLEYLYKNKPYKGIRKIIEKYNCSHYLFTLIKEYYEHITGVYPLKSKTRKEFDPNLSWYNSVYKQ